ncbi:MAG TPA: EAL domain-containing protein [Noviherbaspirillum sp.]|nr:EAL domain-containing protein [Noviherbaspirillum sp.]
MRKQLISNLLLIMFLVGAASGFFVSNVGWWGLYQGGQDIDRLYMVGSTGLQRVSDIEKSLLRSEALFLDAIRKQELSTADKEALSKSDASIRQLLAEPINDHALREEWDRIIQLYTRLADSRNAVLSLLSSNPGAVYRFHTGNTLPLFNELLMAVQQPLLQVTQHTNLAYEKAAANNRMARNALLALTLLASLFFCATAWLTYREAKDRRAKTVLLNKEHTLFRTLFESSNDGVIMMNRDQITDINRAALKMFVLPSAHVIGDLDITHLQPEYQPDGTPSADALRTRIGASLKTGSQRFEWRFKTTDNKEFPAELAIDVAHLTDRSIIQLTIRDITRRKQAESSMHLANQAFESSLEGMTITDANGDILNVNSAFTTITGYSLQEVAGRNLRLLSSGRQSREFYQAMWNSINTTGKWQGEIWNIRKNGSIYPQWLNITSVKNEHGKVTNYVGVFSDISERKSAEERILHQVYYDQLTDLPNRVLFNDRVHQVMGSAKRHPDQHFAVMFLDLDRFKLINDSMGHDAGDQLLQQAAHRLRGSVRDSDTVARMGGDEFTVVLSEIANPRHAASVAQKILDAFRPPFCLHGEEVYVSPSIGISVYPEDGATIELLLRNADMAMYRAKGAGGSRYELYDEGLGTRAAQRMATETALYKALERQEMVLHYQPQFDCDTGKLIGFEALLRWQHPERGLLVPEEFIDIAEETGLILPIGEWVLHTACMQAQEWRRNFPGHRLVSVNLSARQFHSSDLPRQISSALQKSGLPHFCLELEVTENAVMQNLENSIAIMRHMAELGVQFSIDDFGTGYSSLAFLKKLPIHALKIDQSFIRDLDTDQDDATIASVIIAMAGKLGLRVVAEGVEEKKQFAALKAYKGLIGQGHLFGRPVSAELATELIATGKQKLEAA